MKNVKKELLNYFKLLNCFKKIRTYIKNNKMGGYLIGIGCCFAVVLGLILVSNFNDNSHTEAGPTPHSYSTSTTETTKYTSKKPVVTRNYSKDDAYAALWDYLMKEYPDYENVQGEDMDYLGDVELNPHNIKFNNKKFQIEMLWKKTWDGAYIDRVTATVEFTDNNNHFTISEIRFEPSGYTVTTPWRRPDITGH